MTYVDGFVLNVREAEIDKYIEMAEQAGKIWMEHGALFYKECKMEDGKPEMPPEISMKTFSDLSKPNKGETVFFSFIGYKSREHRDEVNAKVMADPRMTPENCGDPNNMPFDMKAMCYGGFESVVDF